jgi:hypothetical protein
MEKVVSTFLSTRQQGARAGLFIVAGQGSYYNASNAPNHLTHQ